LIGSMHLFLASVLLALVLQTTVAELTASLRTVDATSPFVSLDIQNADAFTVGLLHWNTPMDKRFGGSNTFHVSLHGVPVPYIGALVKYASPTLRDYTVLAPSETTTVPVAIHELYDLSVPGIYTVQFDYYLMDYVNETDFGNLPHLRESFTPSGRVTSNTVTIDIRTPALPPVRAPYECSAAERRVITEAAAAFKTLIARAVSLIDGGTTSTYVEWFGVFTQGRWQIAQEVIRLSDRNTVAAYECDDLANVYAYVYPTDTSHTIYVCSAFWGARVIGGFDTQSGTLFHEFSHFNNIGGTDDWVYGVTGARNLARTTPARAVNNADNFEYFGESQFSA